MTENNTQSTNKSGMESFIFIAGFLGIPATPEQLEHTLAIGEEGMQETEMLRASKLLKIKARLSHIQYKNLKKMRMPAIVKSWNDEFFILAQADDEKVMLLYPRKSAPEIMDREEFTEIWDGTILLFMKKGRENQKHKFGFKWFIPTILKYKKQLIQVLIAALTIQVLGVVSPIITQVVVDKVLVHNSISTLNVVTAGLFIVYIYELIMGIAKNYIFTHTTNRVDVILNAKLFSHLFALPLKYFESRRVGDTIARVREVENIRNFLTGTPLNALLDLVFITVYIVVMFLYSTSLTMVVIGSLPLFIILSAITTPLFKKRLDEKFRTGAEAQSFLVESISGVQTVKSFALEPEIEKKWGDMQADYVKSGYKTSILASNSHVVGQFIQKGFDLLILFLGAKAVIDGKITVGQLVAFRMLASRVSGPVLNFVQLWQDFQQASMSVKRIGDIFNTTPEPTIDVTKTRLPSMQGKISFEKVRFRYRMDAPEVIRDLSVTIPPGTVVGIVGRSGSGKSTMAKLVQRLYIPEGGKILIDGVDISMADPAWLRRQIGVVLQENFMFNDTVRNNISIHCPAATIEQIVRVAQIAGAHEFILELQNGYDTMIGERGVNLSGGQKQRLAIARALLANPRILIFDEATSALDYESESIIQRNLKAICKGRTVLIIAHRLSTIMGSDKILVIDKGSLIESGSPKDLLEKKGLFRYLYDQQQRGET